MRRRTQALCGELIDRIVKLFPRLVTVVVGRQVATALAFVEQNHGLGFAGENGEEEERDIERSGDFASVTPLMVNQFFIAQFVMSNCDPYTL